MIIDTPIDAPIDTPYEERPTGELPVWKDEYLEDLVEADLPVEYNAFVSPSGLMDTTTIQAFLEPSRPTVGRIVRYVLPNGEERPGLVVRVWSNTPDPMMCNLVVFTDGENDAPVVPERLNARVPLLLWRTSVHYNETPVPGFWHWPHALSSILS